LKFNFAITIKKYNSAKSETKVKINVFYINCNFEENKNWQKWIINKEITESFSDFLTKIKYKNKLLNRNTPLIRLLTIYNNCCIELDWKSKPNQDHILSIKSINKIFANLVLDLFYKKVEIIVSNKRIIIKRIFINAIKTVGINGKWKK